MSDLAKIIGLIIAIPGFIIVMMILLIGWWSEGLLTEAILEAFNASPLIIIILSIVGILVLIASIFTLIGKLF